MLQSSEVANAVVLPELLCTAAAATAAAAVELHNRDISAVYTTGSSDSSMWPWAGGGLEPVAAWLHVQILCEAFRIHANMKDWMLYS